MTPVEDWVYKEERSLLSFPHSQSLLYSSTHNLNKQSKLRNSPHVLPLLTHSSRNPPASVCSVPPTLSPLPAQSSDPVIPDARRSIWEYKLIRSLQVNRTAGLLTHFPYYRPFAALDAGVTTPPFLLGADHQFLWNSDLTESVLATVYFSISPAFYFPSHVFISPLTSIPILLLSSFFGGKSQLNYLIRL